MTHLTSSSCCWDLSGDSATCKDQRNMCNSLCCNCGATCDVSNQNLDGTILIDSSKSIMDMADHDGDAQLDVSEATGFLDFMGEEISINKSYIIPPWFKAMDA